MRATNRNRNANSRHSRVSARISFPLTCWYGSSLLRMLLGGILNEDTLWRMSLGALPCSLLKTDLLICLILIATSDWRCWQIIASVYLYLRDGFLPNFPRNILENLLGFFFRNMRHKYSISTPLIGITQDFPDELVERQTSVNHDPAVAAPARPVCPVLPFLRPPLHPSFTSTN